MWDIMIIPFRYNKVKDICKKSLKGEENGVQVEGIAQEQKDFAIEIGARFKYEPKYDKPL